MSSKIVEILGGTPGRKGHYLKNIYNQKTNKYFGPIMLNEELESEKEFERLFKILYPERNIDDVSTKVAIIDTGVLHDHPMIKPCLLDSVDFTGEGSEDFNGHGTMVASIFTQGKPRNKFLNVKALDAEGRGEPDSLIKAIEWSIKNGAEQINISAGIYRKKWGLFDCKGDCEVCRTAEKAANRGISVIAAAGNEAGKTYCPAKLGLLKEETGVIAIAAADFDGNPLPNSGYGSISAQGGVRLFRPID
jgi:subtilisin family serine protease